MVASVDALLVVVKKRQIHRHGDQYVDREEKHALRTLKRVALDEAPDSRAPRIRAAHAGVHRTWDSQAPPQEPPGTQACEHTSCPGDVAVMVELPASGEVGNIPVMTLHVLSFFVSGLRTLHKPPVFEQAKYQHCRCEAEHDQGDFKAGGVVWQVRQVAQPVQLRQRAEESAKVCKQPPT